MTTGRINQVAFVADDRALHASRLGATATAVAHTSQNAPSSRCRSLLRNQTDCVPTRRVVRNDVADNKFKHRVSVEVRSRFLVLGSLNPSSCNSPHPKEPSQHVCHEDGSYTTHMERVRDDGILQHLPKKAWMDTILTNHT